MASNLVFDGRTAGHQVSTKYLRLVSGDASKRKVLCVVDDFKTFQAKDKDRQMLTFSDPGGKAFTVRYNNINWGAALKELKANNKSKPQLRTFESTLLRLLVVCTLAAHFLNPHLLN
jgi:hypothetical protein